MSLGGSSLTYRVLKWSVPSCFVIGAGMELFMIKVPIGGKTFYDVAKRKKAERLLELRRQEELVEQGREDRKKRLREKYADSFQDGDKA